MLVCPSSGSVPLKCRASQSVSVSGSYSASRVTTFRHVSKKLPTVSLNAHSSCYRISQYFTFSLSLRRSRPAVNHLDAARTKQQALVSMEGRSSGPILKVLSSAVTLSLLTPRRHAASAKVHNTPPATPHEQHVCAFVAAGCGAFGRWAQPYRGPA